MAHCFAPGGQRIRRLAHVASTVSRLSGRAALLNRDTFEGEIEVKSLFVPGLTGYCKKIGAGSRSCEVKISKATQGARRHEEVLSKGRSGLDIQLENTWRTTQESLDGRKKEKRGKADKTIVSKEWSDGKDQSLQEGVFGWGHTQLVTITNVAPARTWGVHVRVLAPSERHKIRA